MSHSSGHTFRSRLAGRESTGALRLFSRRGLLLSAVAGALALSSCVPAGPDGATGPDTELPPPSHLEVRDVDTTRVELSWRHGGEQDDGTAVSEFRIYRDGERAASTDGTSHSDRGLQPETEYEYRVSAVDEAGAESDPSPAVHATTDPRREVDDGEEDDGEEDGGDGDGDDPPSDDDGDDEEDDEGDDEEDEEEKDDGDDTPPSAPSDLKAEDEEARSIELRWKAAEDPESGIAEYVIYRKLHKEGGEHDHHAGGEEIDRTSSTEYTDRDLEPETEYVYRVSAVNGADLEGEKSEPEKAKTKKEKDEDD